MAARKAAWGMDCRAGGHGARPFAYQRGMVGIRPSFNGPEPMALVWGARDVPPGQGACAHEITPWWSSLGPWWAL